MPHLVSHRAGARRLFGALGLFIVLALILTWPLVANLATHTTGDGIDDPSLAWNLWWINERLVTQANSDIFHVDWMFHPIQINLAFYTLTPLNGLISIPLQLGLSLVVANNLVLLSSFVLGAFGAFLLVLDQRWWFVSAGATDESSSDHHTRAIWTAAALLGGVIYAFASSKLFYASLGQFNIASSQWIPFSMLYLLRMARPLEPGAASDSGRTRIRSAMLAALFFTFQLWAELTYASFLMVFVAILFAWQIIVDRRRALRSWIDLFIPYVVLGVLIFAGMLPILWAMAPDLLTEGDFFASGGGFADIFSANLMGYFFPTILHPVWGDFAATLPFPNDKGQHIFLGYSAVVLSVLGLWLLVRNRPSRAFAWLWGAALLIFFTLTLGPTIRWGGMDTGIPGPFAAISQLPFFSGNRYPSRYSVMLMATVALLSGLGLVWLLSMVAAKSRGRRVNARLLRAVTGMMVAVFVVEHLAAPLPLNDFRIPPIYQRLAQEPGDFAILELPTGWRNGARVLGRPDVLIMMQQWWQTEHGKRRLGGNTSRNPADKFQYFTEAPLLGDLIALMNADRPHIGAVIDTENAEMVAANRPHAAQILSDVDIRAVLVHEERATPQLLRFVRDVLPLVEVDRWQGDDWSGAPSTIVRYAVAAEDAPSERTISLADENASLYLGEGWATLPTDDGLRYAIRRAPVLLVDLPTTCTQVILDWHGPAHGVGMTVNGREVTLQPGAANLLEATLPSGVAVRPVDRIVLRFEGESLPAGQVAQPPDGQRWPLGATGVALPAERWIVARSAGEEVGDFAQVFIDGRNVARNERGYNLVALDAQSAVLDSVAFDTSGDENASAALAAWIDRWPAGTIIAGAVNDEASLKLSEAAIMALQSLGATIDLRDRFRWSHAFIGAIGAPTGSAIESAALIRPVTVTLGAPIDGANVYGGLRSLTTARCDL
ncbi:MAG: interleukin-like EMT inducer domain-containing protein [Caldilinea sp.]